MLQAQPYAAPAVALASRTDGVSTKVTGALATTADSPSTGPFVFAYDEAGRLVGVADAAGNTATYTYDAAGNTLSIGRGSAAVSILAFSPSSGPVGTNVTIVGAGFSATAAQNAVTFNGVSAAVVTATPNQLVAVVPGGATTGPIRVTCPAGSAVSANSFTVGPNNAPSISGFMPTIGTSGSTVTITGTNFEPVTGNNRVAFNGNLGTVSSAAPTTIGTVVSSTTTSGPITVSTPNGRATSTGDFFVPPSPYTAADVEVTGRMAIGETRAVTITQANKIGLIVFSGSAGQRVSLNVSFGAGLYPGACNTVSIRNPDGSQLLSQLECGSSYFSDVRVLPATGVYTITMDPGGSTVGTATLTLYNVPPDATASLVAAGSPVTVTTTTPGQNAQVSFSGTAGQRVSLKVSFGAGLYPGACNTVSIRNPDGTQFLSQLDCGATYFSDARVLPATGVYVITVNPGGTTFGSATLTLYNVPPDATASIVAGGSPVTVTTTTPSQNAQVSFSGTAGQRVSLKVSFGAGLYPGACNTVSIQNPDGTQFLSQLDCGATYFSDARVLPATGVYVITVNPGGTTFGSATLTLYNVPPDVTASIVPGGSPVTVTTTTPGQNAILTFAGSAGQSVSLKVSFGAGMLDTCNYISIQNPDGTPLLSQTTACGSVYSSAVLVLPATGAYTVTVNPGNLNVGSTTLTLYNLPTVTSISPRSGTTLGGTPVVLTGSNFQNGATVSIGGVSATGVSVVGNTITATTGAHATGTVSVSVTNPDNLSGTLSNSYFYDQPSGTLSFYTVNPCRLVDTRNPSGPLGGPSLGAGGLRVFTAIGSCGIPAGAKSLSVNVTVAAPTAAGFVGFYPGNAIPMGTSSLSFSAGQTRASSTMIKLSTDGLGTLAVQNGAPGNVDVILDLNGYFM